jgi:hypothetical protein
VKTRIAVLIVVVVFVLRLGSQKEIAQAGAGAAPQLPPATIAGEIKAEAATTGGKHSDYPAVAVTADGVTWVACVEWNGEDADRVVVRRKPKDGRWSDPIELRDGGWDHYSPAIAARGDGVLVVWSGQSDGNFELYDAEIGADGKPTQPRQLTNAPHSDFNARAVSDAQGNVTVVWQSFRSGRSDVYARRLTGNRWSAEVRVSPSEMHDWEPAVALDGKGVAWIAWDSYHHGNYDVFLRSFDGSKLGEVVSVTTEPTAQFHSTVAVDKQDRVWVAWNEAGENWGKDFSRVSRAPGSNGLHFSRTLDARVYANGQLMHPQADIKKILTGRMSRYAELPHLAVDGAGTLWMVFRHWTLAQPHEIYHFYATKLDANGWATPWKLGDSSGQNTQYAGVALGADGVLRVTYSSDGRSPDVKPKDAVHSLPYNVYLVSLPKSSSSGQPLLTEISNLKSQISNPLRRERARLTVGGKTYTLLFGDCHRHTDVRGHSGVDGSAWDTYRYALDAAQLDYLGLGDHNQVTGGTWFDGLRDYQWWTQQKFADLFTCPPTFIGLYSYEHSLSRPSGHRNIIYLKRGAPLRVASRDGGVNAPDNQPPNLWKWMEENVLTMQGQKVVIVPHTFAEASQPLADWNWQNAPFDCLLEMYQGARSSYEAYQLPEKERRGSSQVAEPGHTAQEALAKGNVYGFVSFSDHGSTHNSWAGVWVDAVSREGILNGMLARRTFAASDEIILQVTADNHAAGESFTAKTSAPPVLNINVTAPDTIVRVDVVKDGKYIYTTNPNERSARLQFRDMDAKAGKTYYYVRVFQRDPENPDGDPEIAWSSPFFVTYE